MTFAVACRSVDVADRTPTPVTVGGVDVVLVRVNDTMHALRDQCSHAAVPLSDGDVEGCALECMMHGSLFDLRTGRPTNLPATAPVAVYPVRLDGDDVLVDVDNPITEEN